MTETSVVIPTYNRESTVDRAIQSVLDQTYEDFEIVVVDDCSDDNTVKRVQGISDGRITLIRHKTNKGGNAARNTGIKHSQGDYICFLDSDDELTDGHLEIVVERLKRESDDCAGITTGYSKYKNEKRVDSWHPNEGKITLETALGKNERFRSQKNVIGGFSCTTFRSSVFEVVGLLDEQLTSLQDLDFYLRVLQDKYICGIQDKLVQYHRDGDQISSNVEAKREGKEQFIHKHGELLDRNMMANFHYTMGFVFAEQSKMGPAVMEFRKAIDTYPIHPLYHYHYVSAKLGEKPFNMSIDIKKRVKRLLINK